MLGVEGLGLVGVRSADPGVLPPDVAALDHVDRVAATFDDDDGLDGRGALEGLVDVGLELDDLAAAPAAVGGDDELGLAVVDAVLERLGAEAAEDDGVDGPDAGAGQHGDDRLGDHRHIDGDAVALAHPHVLEDVGDPADVEMELLVGDGADIARLALEDDRGLVLAVGAEVAVEAVLGDVELAAGEPLRVRRIPLEGLFERLAPDEMLLGLTGPELFWAIDRLGVELLVQGLAPKICLGFELGRRPELPGFPGN